ncbi:hypothetical protein [Sinorhizobium saheli]|uniref:hypothetical protein n=1 Tax=Sinorhizobium saheli TaxID=36856 RepID=UPI000B1FA5F4|nr:hypothetical protein [Sinorhizobium saheli]
MSATCEIIYDVDGLRMVAHLARPDGEGPWPTVLIGHDGSASTTINGIALTIWPRMAI